MKVKKIKGNDYEITTSISQTVIINVKKLAEDVANLKENSDNALKLYRSKKALLDEINSKK